MLDDGKPRCTVQWEVASADTVTTTSRGPICYAEHGWLVAAAPAGARRFRVADARIAATLTDAGAELVDEGPEVEIGPRHVLRGDASTALVSLGAPLLEGDLRAVRAVRRVGRALRVRLEAARALSRLRRLGYRETSLLTWDFTHPVRIGGMGRQREGGLVEYLPANAVAAGGRGARGATLYDAAVVDAHAALESFQPGAPVMGAGLLISFAEEGVLRVAVGPARRQLESQVAALRTLLDCSAPAVRNRVPKLLGRGRAGLADWSLESRLVGSRPASGLSDRVVEDCLDFLAALNSVGEAGEASASLREQAGVVASGLGDEEGRAVRDLAERLEDELTDVPRGFAHGDFHRGNMLESQGRLAGVVDWDAAGSGRLAFLDLLHLRLFSVPRRGGSHWGPALLDELVPWARAGGDAVLRGYCRRIGFEPSLRQLEALTIAYWLDRAAYELSMYADRSERREWQHRNVHLVLQAATARFPS